MKLIFTLPDSILSDRSEFLKFAYHSSIMISNIDHYKNGIGLVITYHPDEDSTDERLIEYRGRYFERIIGYLKNNTEEEKMKRFATTFFKRDNESTYKRIRVHRQVRKPGKLDKMPQMVAEKKSVTELIIPLLFSFFRMLF